MLDLSAAAGYFERLETLRSAAGSVDLRVDLPPSWVANTVQSIGEGLNVLETLGAAAEGSAERAGSDDVRLMLTSIADVCFLAQGELRSIVTQLQRSEARPDVALVVAESGYRKLRRVVSRVQWLLAPFIGRSSDVAEQEQDVIETSITVRRLYAQFRRSVPPCNDDAELMQAMRGGAMALATLIGDVDAVELRIQDRQVARSLQERIETWLRDGGSPLQGRRIHADLVAFAELTRLVNRRQELRAHDAAVLDSVMRDAFPAMLGDENARSSVFEALARVGGLDDTLDALAERLRVDGDEVAYVSLRQRAVELCAV